jgi:hypothetical protein
VLICRFNLLCDNCNWEFAGFAVPGTTSSRKKKNVKKAVSAADENSLEEMPADEPKKERSAKRSGAAMF